MSNRRDFLRTVGFLGMAGMVGGGAGSSLAVGTNTNSPKRQFTPLKFGIIADIHKDLTPEVDERLDAFVKQVEVEKPDFVISLGDFAHAKSQNDTFRNTFRSVRVPSYHVLGNHEMDTVSKKEAAAFLNMPAPYYSFDISGYHGIVMDPNFIYTDGKFLDYEKSNYFKYGGAVSYVNDEQCDWIEEDLKKTNLPTILFSHQSLLHDSGGIPNRAYIQRILEKENQRVGFQKVIACFNGHHHQDYYRCMSDIHYFSINSVSYFWHGKKMPGRYSEQWNQKYRHLENMTLYKDPLYCFVTLTPQGDLTLKGRMSQWAVPPVPEEPSKSVRYGRERTPNIVDRHVRLD